MDLYHSWRVSDNKGMLFGALASYFVLLDARGAEFHDSKAGWTQR